MQIVILLPFLLLSKSTGLCPITTRLSVTLIGHLEDHRKSLSCSGIFRDHLDTFLGVFSTNIGVTTSLYAETFVVIYVFEFAHARGWTNLWLEFDPLLMILGFSNVNLVPLKFKVKWKNCLQIIRNFRSRFSHIYREGNTCANKQANDHIFVDGLVWWDQLSSCGIVCGSVCLGFA